MEGVSSPLAVSSAESSMIASGNVGPDQTSSEGCLPSSIRAALSFVSGHSTLQRKEFLQSYTGSEAYLPARLENGLNLEHIGAKENPIVIEDEQDENAINDIPTCPELCLDSSPMEDKSRNYLQKHSYVYKRRKLQGNSVTLLPKETQIDDGKEYLANLSQCYDDVKCHDISAFSFPYMRYSMIFLQSETNDLNSQSNGLSEGKKYNVSAENGVDCEIPGSEGISSYLRGSSDLLLDTGRTDMDIIDVEEASSENRSVIEEDSTSLQVQSSSSYDISDCNLGQIAASVKHDLTDAPECTSCVGVTHLSRETDPEKEWCISVLKESGLLGWFVPSREFTAAGHPGVVGDGSLPQLCKICGSLEDSTRTLICDMCDEAFHMSCCNPKVKSVPAEDDWYCQFCKRKRKKSGNKRLIESKCHQNIVNKSAPDRAELFSRMLEDIEPYTTQVRIANAFQADVPDWAGKIYDDAEMLFMGEPLEMEFPERNLLNEVWTKGWKPARSLLPGLMENWLQCQNVIVIDGACSEGQKTNDVICGKWRRAPLSEVQNDNWDCSCSVVWDPVHADCAVPQELETEEIMMRLKATEMAKLQYVNKKRKTK